MNDLELTSVLWAVFFGGIYIVALVFSIRDGLDEQARRNAADDSPFEEKQCWHGFSRRRRFLPR